MSDRSAAPDMPRLDVFDQEFGREPEPIAPDEIAKPRPRVRTFLGLVVVAAIISALAVAWSGTGGPSRSDAPTPASASSQAAHGDASSDQISRLTRQIEALQQEIRELTEAQQEAASTIADLKVAEHEPRSSAAYWYSDLSALSFGMNGQLAPDSIAASPRRPVTARPESREPRRRENGGAPLSLEPPQ